MGFAVRPRDGLRRARTTSSPGRSSIRDDAKFSDGEARARRRRRLHAQHDPRLEERSGRPLHGRGRRRPRRRDARSIKLSKPYNALLYTLAVVGIVPEHAYGPDYGTKPIGSGRYVLIQWDRGQQVILDANPSYYGEEPQHRARCRRLHGGGRRPRGGASPARWTWPTPRRRSPTSQVGRLLRCEAYDTVDSRGVAAAGRARRAPSARTVPTRTRPATTSPATSRSDRP